MRRELSKDEISFIKKTIGLAQDDTLLLHLTKNEAGEYIKHIIIYERNGEPYCTWFQTQENDEVVYVSNQYYNIPFESPGKYITLG
jgi:hypothetical protein